MSSALNRRGLFALLGRPFQRTMEPSRGEGCPGGASSPEALKRSAAVSQTSRSAFPPAAAGFQHSRAPAPASVVAVIQGRRCIALTSFCAACVERCPVRGAMQVTNGMPSVVPDACTGCGICHEVCPAPTNAVLMLPRRKTTPVKIAA